MSGARRGSLLGVLIGAIVIHASFSVPVGGISWIEVTLEALERAVGFFERNYDSINLDGFFGLRIAEGKLILNSFETGTKWMAFSDHIFKCILLTESLYFDSNFTKSLYLRVHCYDFKLPLVQVTTCRLLGTKPLPETIDRCNDAYMRRPVLTLKGPIPYIYGTQVWLSLCLQMS